MKRYIYYVVGIMKGRISHKRIPIFVTLCVTKRCNLRCLYCYRECLEKNGEEFTTEEAIGLIDELAMMGTKYISLNGGEALLRNDIERIVDRVRENRMLCHMSTNALLVKNNLSIMKKIDSLAISIDGIGQSNDLNRGKGVYDKVIETIEYLHKNKIVFHTHTVLTKNNLNAVNEIMEIALRYNFKAQFSTLRVNLSPDKTICLGDDELRHIVRKILDYKRRGLPIFFTSRSYENLLKWPFSYEDEAIFDEMPKFYKPIECFIKKFSCHIEADGSVYPCIVLVNKFKALGLADVGFKKAWENLSHNRCRGCYNVCCNDLNLIFGLRPNSIWNAVKIVMDRIL